MLSKVEVFSPRVATAPFPLTGGSVMTDPIQIRDIDGLGPVDADFSTTQYANIDGVSESGSTIGARNIVLTVGFNPNVVGYTAMQLRKILYSYFSPKQKVRLQFTTAVRPVVEIAGKVETVEPDIFARDAQFQISILCADPYFYELTDTVVNGLTVAGTDPALYTATDVTYAGSADTGFTLDITKGSGADVGPSSTITELVVVNDIASRIRVTPSPINAAQYLRFNTRPGEKSVSKMFVPAGPPQSALGWVFARSSWPLLQPGLNKVMVGIFGNAGLSWTMTYKNRYGGL